MNRNLLLGALGGFGAGAATMYLLDPDRGARRRAGITDKALSRVRTLPRAMRLTREDLANRTYGAWAEAKHIFKNDEASDDVIEARVRSKMGRIVSHPHAIRTSVTNGNVVLSGPIFADETSGLLKCVAKTAGVRSVENQLEEHETAGGISSLQGNTRRESRSEFMQQNWSPSARFVAGSSGAAALAYGLLKRDALSITLGTLGAAVLARSATNLELQRLLGTGGGRRAVDIQKTITVNAPVDVVYSLWSNFENFPLFMSNVAEVTRTDDRLSHWKVYGPTGVLVEWDAETTVDEPENTIAWKSLPGAAIANAGIVRFRPAGDGSRTEIHVRLSYNPPAGALGHAVAFLFGRDPKTQMDADLMRMKTLLETGEAPRDAAQPMEARQQV